MTPGDFIAGAVAVVILVLFVLAAVSHRRERRRRDDARKLGRAASRAPWYQP